MSKSLRLCFIIVLLYGFSNLAYANIDVTVYGGMNLRKGLCLEMDHNNSFRGGGNTYNYQGGKCNSIGSFSHGSQNSYNFGPQRLDDKMPWIIGGDIIYRISTMRGLGIGVRYQYMHIPEGQQNVVFVNVSPKLSAHRISLLVNYRYVINSRDEGPFIGAILSLDIFRHAKIGLGLNLPASGLSSSFSQINSKVVSLLRWVI